MSINIISGVYRLLGSSGDVVYIGMSKDISKRIAVHSNSDKEFESYDYIQCDGFEMKKLEAELIQKHEPKYNKFIPRKVPAEGRTIRLRSVEKNVSNLLSDAADRVGMKKHAFIYQLLEKAAGKEYALQQIASSKE